MGPISTLIYELKPELKDKDTRRNDMIVFFKFQSQLESLKSATSINLIGPKYHIKKVYIWAVEFHTGRIQMVHHLIFKKQHNLAACSVLRGLIICKIGAFRLGVKHADAMHSKKP